ncbi:MAG: hypothetical protein LAT64_07330 [Phycisphaerales bacterium]|nr:hypothetical protein [Planctomycetota bacterium]MCH8508568.1 hypothetical protein [Phycisphaerales bacterium]
MAPIRVESPAPSALQTYQSIIYSRGVHPELFDIRDRRAIVHGRYAFEAWLMPGRHVLLFEHAGHALSELVTDQERGLPDSGVVEAFLCAGEREMDRRFEEMNLGYMTSAQTEQLGENLYHATYEELDELARDTRAMTLRWTDEAGACMSIIDTQRFAREVHIQAYHMLAREGLVLRTQTIFEHN